MAPEIPAGVHTSAYCAGAMASLIAISERLKIRTANHKEDTVSVEWVLRQVLSLCDDIDEIHTNRGLTKDGKTK